MDGVMPKRPRHPVSFLRERTSTNFFRLCSANRPNQIQQEYRHICFFSPIPKLRNFSVRSKFATTSTIRTSSKLVATLATASAQAKGARVMRRECWTSLFPKREKSDFLASLSPVRTRMLDLGKSSNRMAACLNALPSTKGNLRVVIGSRLLSCVVPSQDSPTEAALKGGPLPVELGRSPGGSLPGYIAADQWHLYFSSAGTFAATDDARSAFAK